MAIETAEEQRATERKMRRFRRDTERRILRGQLLTSPGRSTPGAAQLYDTVSYRDKTNPRGGPPGMLFRGRAARVAGMGLSPTATSMESLLGDWTKAAAAEHFFSDDQAPRHSQRPQSASASYSVSTRRDEKSGQDDGSVSLQSTDHRGLLQWSAWSAWQDELSYRQGEEEKAGGCSASATRGIAIRGCSAGMLTVPRFLQAV